jgi:hypothetical protein
MKRLPGSTELCLASVIASLVVIQQAGCAPPGPEEVGVVSVAITLVPADVGCVRITVAGTRTVSQSFDVTAGASSVLTMSGTPTGAVTVSGDAFAGACAAVGPQSSPNWTGDPVMAQVASDAVASVSLVMRRNGRIAVGVDFQDDVEPGKPTCTDGVRNGTETDVDCGGGVCPACGAGKQCQVDADCAAGTCTGGACAASSIATAVTLTSSANPAVFGQVVAWTATVTAANGATPTGNAIFFVDNDAFPTSLSGGVAQVVPTNPSVGTHTVVFRYVPNGAFAPSMSAPLMQTVNPAPTRVTIAAAPSAAGGTAPADSAVTFTATVSPVIPPPGTNATPVPAGGSIIFTDASGNDAAPRPLFLGAASIRLTFLASGSTFVRARYTGDASFEASPTAERDFDVTDGAPTCMAPPDGLVSQWMADGSFQDAVGGNNGASAGGISFTGGFRDLGFGLDRNTPGSFVEVPDSASLDLTTGITIDAWIRPSDDLGGRIVDKISAFGGDGYLLDVIGSRLRLQIGGGAAAVSQNPLPLPPTFAPVNFIHVAGTFDGATLSVYVNGELAGFANIGGTIPVNDLPLRIGADSGGGSLFSGVIDEARIFDHALSGDEIHGLYQQGFCR